MGLVFSDRGRVGFGRENEGWGKRNEMRLARGLPFTNIAGPSRRLRRWLLGLGAVALVSLSAASAAHAGDRIYWSNYETNQIAWADLNGDGGGGTVNTTGATVDGPMGLAADPSRGLIYWVNWAADRGTTISYAHLDGSGAGDLDITGTTIDAPVVLTVPPPPSPLRSAQAIWSVS